MALFFGIGWLECDVMLIAEFFFVEYVKDIFFVLLHTIVVQAVSLLVGVKCSLEFLCF